MTTERFYANGICASPPVARPITALLLAGAALLALTAPSAADPMGGVVVGGSATISGSGTGNVTVNQSSQRAIINWSTFNIGAGESTTFVQPNSSAVVLNRVTGGLGPSEIYGTLSANGQVFVINRDGVLIGPSGVINTAGFLATTSDIKNADFMAGRYNFNIPGRPDASIVNQGRITATSGGFAALVAPGVRNSGTISATLGTVSLAAGNSFTLDLYGDKLIQLAPGDQIAAQVIDVATGKPLSALVHNQGTIKAGGGRVELTAAAARRVVDSVINNSGVIEADTVGTRAGKIVLGAATQATKPAGAPKQTIKLSGTISAAGKSKGTKGGTVAVTGENIEVAGARIDASGDAGGGKVMLGGDWAGGKPASGLVNNQSAALETYQLGTATTLNVDAATVIDASAKTQGHGGKVILWADSATTFAGTILARGGAASGNGGFVEVSGKMLDFAGSVDTRAPSGVAGTLLLDPADYYIMAAADPWTPPAGASVITAETLQSQLANNNVVIATDGSQNPVGQSGSIFVYAGPTWTGSTSLTLSAHRDIYVYGTIANSGSGNLTLRADSRGTGVGTVEVQGSIDFASSTGQVAIFYNPTTPTICACDSKYTHPNDYSSSVSGNLTAYMLVNDAIDLDQVRENLAGTYALGRDIDASSLTGFTPIGGNGLEGSFTGKLDGQGHTISNLTIAPTDPAIWNIGLFGVTAIGSEIRNLNLSNVHVTANPNVPAGIDHAQYQYVGTVVGENAGTLSNVHVTGSLVGTGIASAISAGGLVGMVSGTIVNSSAAVDVSIGGGSAWTSFAGGLAGRNVGSSGLITGSSATGSVSGGASSVTGGLVGDNGGTITTSTAAGAVSVTLAGAAGAYAGGLVGTNSGDSKDSYATGSVGSSGGDVVGLGGLAGLNAGNILDSYATGNVSATGATSAALGGLVGINTGDVSSSLAASHAISHALGNVGTDAAGASVGGLVGTNFGSVSLAYAKGSVSGAAASFVGGFAGLNIGSISQAYATGAVSGGDGAFLGGFVGANVSLPGGEIGWPGSISQAYALGQVSGGADVVAAAFAALNLGSIDQAYAAGRVTGGAGSTLGGLVASSSGVFPPGGGPSTPPTLTGTVTNSYWDRQTTGQSTSAGGTAMDTAALAGSTLPPGFSASAWVHGPYPQLVALGAQITIPGPPVLPPLDPVLPPSLQAQQQFISQLVNNNPLTPPPVPDVVNVQGAVGGTQQSQPSQQGPAAARAPGQLDAGPGRFFFIPPPGETRFVADQLILYFDSNVPLDELQRIAAQAGLAIIASQPIGLIGKTAYQLQITDGGTVADKVRQLVAVQAIAGATPAYLYALTQDPAARSSGPLEGDAAQYVLEKLRLVDIHRTLRGSNVSIAVIDSEIDATHPDLAGVVVSRYDATGVEEKPHAHGTGMAGAIASHRRLVGTAPGARLLAVHAFSTKASSAESTTFNILKGLDYAVSNGVRIVNMSFAGPRDPSMERALKAAYDRGVILIAAAGNAGPRSAPLYPAADPNVIAVTATDVDDKLFAGANRGRHIAVAAPGVDILVPAPDASYQMTTGTSVATAHVSGIVALMLERNPALKPADVRRILTASAKRLGPNDEFGAGLIDPARALQLAAPRSAEAGGARR